VFVGAEPTLNRAAQNPNHAQQRLKAISVVQPLIGMKTLVLKNIKKFVQNVNPNSKSGLPSARLSMKPVDALSGGETFYRTIN